MRWRAAIALGALMFALAGAGGRGFAQTNPEPTREQLQLQIQIMQEYVSKLEAQAKANAADLEARPKSKDADIDPDVLKAYKQAQIKQYESLVTQVDLVNQAFYEQRIISRFSLGLVAFVVISGVVFSALQLWQTIKVAGSPLSNDVEISASRIKLTTSVIGLIVLGISLAFFYIYFTINLKIERVGNAPTPILSSAAK